MKTWKVQSSSESVIVEAETVEEAIQLGQSQLLHAVCFADDISHKVIDLSRVNDPATEAEDDNG